MGGLGILKFKEHVENPNQTRLREGIVRLLVGGGLFALPIVYEAMASAIGGGSFGSGGAGFSSMAIIGGALGTMSQFLPTGNVNQVLANIVTSIGGLPGAVSAVSYLLAIVFGVAGILKIREHVDNPEQVGLREPAIRFIAGGALFALPPIFSAMQTTISGDGASPFDVFTDILSSIGGLLGLGGAPACNPAALIGGALGGLGGLLGGAGGTTVGGVICSTFSSSAALPAFLTAVSYLFGIVIGVWGVLKLKDNVLNPQQTPIWDGVNRLLAAGAFFSLPYMVTVAKNTVAALMLAFDTTNYKGAPTGAGLDAMMVGFMADIYGPMLFIMNFFGYVAGTILIMIGISRLLKSAQEGPRGPGGLGTMMTFLAAGALIALSPMIGAFSGSLFGDQVTKVGADIAYTTGMATNEVAHVQAVISSVIQFMLVLGVVSFARGIFIVREVAEGSQQASLMAGLTHLIGGALAVNLGPVINAVQETLGLTGYGVDFS
jgi:hypothetical protein